MLLLNPRFLSFLKRCTSQACRRHARSFIGKLGDKEQGPLVEQGQKPQESLPAGTLAQRWHPTDPRAAPAPIRRRPPRSVAPRLYWRLRPAVPLQTG
jgi:hypothetical protein